MQGFFSTESTKQIKMKTKETVNAVPVSSVVKAPGNVEKHLQPMSAAGRSLLRRCKGVLEELDSLDLPDKVATINSIKQAVHKVSPFHAEPTDCVVWVPSICVVANDYNPNTVAMPEMKLLEHSIESDGYTQPIVSWLVNGWCQVVDGFHRNRVGRESEVIRKRIKSYLPITIVSSDRTTREDRMAATIRHNRARGKHTVDGMSDIVVELKRRNWSDGRIGKELGMDPDEVLRLCQISGLGEMFSDGEFTEAWEPDEIDGNVDLTSQEVDLEWYAEPLSKEGIVGWDDRTDMSSVLYGDDPKVMGQARKSHVCEDWHWYVYTQPMKSGRVGTREEAKNAVDRYWE